MVQAMIYNQSVYGAQPRSLSINWMKYNVLDENVHPNTEAPSQPVKLSPLRQRLQLSGEQLMQKREKVTQNEIETRIEEARLRRDAASQEANLRRHEPRVRRAHAQVQRQTYLSEMARKRHSHEEAIVGECQQNIQRIREREASMASAQRSCIAEVDEQSENDSRKGLEALAQMNVDLEALIRSVYKKIQHEQSNANQCNSFVEQEGASAATTMA